VGCLFLEYIEKIVEVRYNKLSDMCNLSKEVQTEEICMLKNNIEVDVKVKCIENGITQAQLAEKIKTTSPYVNRIIKKQDGVVNKTFVQMLEALGYDIELTYVKRSDEGGVL
jgi:predicted XRE-type DNA-binding protein